MTRPRTHTIFIASGVFLLLLLLKFPFGNLKGTIFNRIYSQTRILLIAEEIYPYFFGWPGIGVKNVDVTLPVAGEELSLSCKKLVLRVGLGSFFPPTPSVSLSMKSLKKGGDLYVKYRRLKTRTTVGVDASEVSLAQLTWPGFSQPVDGMLNAEADFTMETTNLAQSTGGIELTVKQLTIPTQNLQGIILPEMKIGALKAKIIVKNGMADFSSFQIGSKESDLQGTVMGDLRLGSELRDSQLNLTLRFQLSDRYRQLQEVQSLVLFLDSYKSSKGGYAMRWNSRIGDLTTAPFPQQVVD